MDCYKSLIHRIENPLRFKVFGVPVFVDLRTAFTKKRVTGYAAIDLGYSFDLSDDPVRGIHYFKPMTSEEKIKYAIILSPYFRHENLSWMSAGYLDGVRG
jgi:hypothetical protein